MRTSFPLTVTFVASAVAVSALAATALFAVTPSAQDARASLSGAFTRLEASSYTKRETIVRPVNGLGAVGVITTERNGLKTRQVAEFDLSGLGLVRIESVRDGARAAVRVNAPAFASARWNDVRGVAASTADASQQRDRMQAVMVAAQLPATNQPLGTWQRNDRHEIMQDDDAGFGGVALVGVITHARYGNVWRFDYGASSDGATKVVWVNVTSGLPVAEEVTDASGTVLVRTEYLDVGRTENIFVPGCLR